MMHSLFDHVPPHDLEAERSVIGSCLLHADVIDEVLPLVRPASFYATPHQQIFAAILAMHAAGQNIDTVTLNHQLQNRGELEDVGGPLAITQILAAVPHAAYAEHYARIVREMSDRRRLLRVATDVLQDIHAGQAAIDVCRNAESAVHHILEAQQLGTAVTLSEAFDELLDNLDRDDSRGLPTGFPDLDELMTGGLWGGRHYIIAARPSMGKTALALNIAIQLAQQQIPVVLFTLEQSSQELTARIASSLSRVDLKDITTGRLTDEQRFAISETKEKFGGLPIRIVDIAHQTVTGITSQLRPMVRRGEAAVAIIDYLQLLTPEDGKIPREQQVAQMSRALKNTARDLDIPIIVLAQLNRMLEQREGKRPRLSDLRESGSIEQDADVVLFLYREQVYDSSADPSQAELIVSKNRQGRTGSVDLHWQPEIVTFRSAAPTYLHTGGSHAAPY